MLRFSIEGTDQIGDWVWHARLHPSQVSKLGPCSSMHGKLSVILITAAPGETGGKLEFEPDSAHVLNIGASSEAIFVFDPQTEAAGATSGESSPPTAVAGANGDQAFLHDLPDVLRPLGEEFLTRVRQQSPGWLVYYPDSGRYVAKPDNFWTVRIQQPRANNLQLTVRGDPNHFVVPDDIDLKKDRPGYSRFVISHSDQIPGALSIIGQARRKGSR